MKRAAVAYVTREDGRMLVVWNKRYAGWTMPGGLVEEGETPGVACARELQEETGLVSFKYEQIYEAPTEPHLNDGRGTHCHVFRVAEIKSDPDAPRECELGCPVTWFTREEFLKWSPFAKFYEKMFAALESA
jgi:ADP-ribose pyrophosphatase YjhB (NUDIX family)